MSVNIYKDGPLKGQAAVSVLLSVEATEWLRHASGYKNYSLDALVNIAAEEAALEWAKSHGLLK